MKIRYPKSRSVGFSLMLFALLSLAGCCSCQERYDPFLGQIEDNLANDIRPKYERALRASGRPDDLVANDLGLVDDTIEAIQRVRGEGPAVEEKKAECPEVGVLEPPQRGSWLVVVYGEDGKPIFKGTCRERGSR